MTELNAPSVQYRPVPRPLSSFAISGFVLSLLWLGGLGSLVGLVLAMKGMRETRDGSHSGQGLAVAALILSVLGFLASIVVVLVVVAAGQQQMEDLNEISRQVGS